MLQCYHRSLRIRFKWAKTRHVKKEATRSTTMLLFQHRTMSHLERRTTMRWMEGDKEGNEEFVSMSAIKPTNIFASSGEKKKNTKPPKHLSIRNSSSKRKSPKDDISTFEDAYAKNEAHRRKLSDAENAQKMKIAQEEHKSKQKKFALEHQQDLLKAYEDVKDNYDPETIVLLFPQLKEIMEVMQRTKI